MSRIDKIALAVAIISAIALVVFAIVTDTPLLTECHVNTPC